VVIPVYNEVGNIHPLTDELTRALDGAPFDHEVLWVEDESDDGTAELVDGLAMKYGHHQAIHLRRSWGQSAALAAGFDHARGDIIVPMDGDRQNDPADIPDLVAALRAGDYDCVSGRRVDRQDPLAKRVPSRIQTTLAKLTGPDINDFGCTLKAYDAAALADIDLYGEGHRYIPAKLYDRGYRVTEQDVHHRPREHGESRYGVGRLVRGFVDLVFHWFWVRFSTRPMHLLGGLGVALLAVGLGVGSWSVIQRFAFGVPLGPRLPRLLFVSLSVTTGLVFVGVGFLAEMLTKLLYRNDTEYRIEEVVG
jgi:glycosyltransferase involved in cell wall biosynthesis